MQLRKQRELWVVQEDDLPASFNVEISKGLDSPVGDPNDVEEVVMKRKRVPGRKKKMKWRPWGTRKRREPSTRAPTTTIRSGKYPFSH
jgi:hypothetical protein